MSTNFNPMNLMGLFGGDTTGYGDLLTEQQKKAIANQSMLAMASKLLQAGAPSATPTNLGASLGMAVEAGMGAQQKGQEQALSSMMTKAKIQEMLRQQKSSEAIRQMLLGGQATSGAPVSSGQALAAPASMAGRPGPTAQRAGMIGQPTAMDQPANPLAMLSPLQRALISGMPATEQAKALMDATAGAAEYGAPVNAMINGQPVQVQYNKFGQQKIVPNAAPYQATPADIQGYQFAQSQGYKGSFLDWKQANKAGTNVSVNTGQTGFKNEMDLKSAFKSEPIYTDYQNMRSAYSQIQASLKQETPIADTAAATKIMKLLDPGSVVRESELGMAMAATGRMDRLQNYVNNWLSGQKLTPNQRIEFGNLANELMAASAQAYNMKRGEYENLGSGYQLNANRALGPLAQVPSIMKQEQPKPDDENRKKNLKNLLGL